MDSDFLTGTISGISLVIIIIIYYAWQKKTQRKKFEQFLREKKIQDKIARKAYNSTHSSEMFQANGNHGNMPIVKENTPSPTTQQPPKPASWISVKKYDSPPSVPTINLSKSVTPRRDDEIINQTQNPQSVKEVKEVKEAKALIASNIGANIDANDIYSTTKKLSAATQITRADLSNEKTEIDLTNKHKIAKATEMVKTPFEKEAKEAKETKEAKEAKDNNLHESPNSVSPSEPFHILVADDSLVVRKKLNDLLTRAGYSTIMKKDGWEAFTHLNHETSQKPDLIITDIEMPQMNGFQLIENIRKNQGIQNIPIVVISSHVDMHFKLLESGSIQGFIAKPFENDLLLGQVGYLLNANS